jgi:hypothetical protein
MKNDAAVKLEGKMIALNQHIEMLAPLELASTNPFWSAYKERLEWKLAHVEREMDGFDKLTDDQIRMTLEQRRMLKMCIDMPESITQELANLRERVAELKVKIKEARGRVRTNSH